MSFLEFLFSFVHLHIETKIFCFYKKFIFLTPICGQKLSTERKNMFFQISSRQHIFTSRRFFFCFKQNSISPMFKRFHVFKQTLLTIRTPVKIFLILGLITQNVLKNVKNQQISLFRRSDSNDQSGRVFTVIQRGFESTVTIDRRPQCSCDIVKRTASVCAHILFVLTRVYKVPVNSDILPQVYYDDQELEYLQIMFGKIISFRTISNDFMNRISFKL